MNQILPIAKIKQAQRYVYLHDALTGRVFASQPTYSFQASGARWEWIARKVAEEFDCRTDDVECVDTDDRFDNITVDGKIVGYVEVN